MASSIPAAVFLDENLPIHRGNRADGMKGKPLKSSARGALRDVSNTAKPPVPNVSKGTSLKERCILKEKSILKEKPPVRSQEATKNTVKKTAIFADEETAKPSARRPLQDLSNTANIFKGTSLKERSTKKEKFILKEKPPVRSQEATKNPVKKTAIFADEEAAKCHEWAKTGVEGTHFTGNDAQKLDKDKQDKRVKKKVEKIMSALHDWPATIFDHVLFPPNVVDKFFEEVNGLELEPEILLDITTRISSPGRKAKLAEESFNEVELDDYPFLDYKPVEFRLRDE